MDIIVAGVLPLLVGLVAAGVDNNTLGDEGEIANYPAERKAPYPDITFTTPDIPLAREYAPYPPTDDYGAPAREYGVPAREYGVPAREYGVPTREYGVPPPFRQYSPPFRSSYPRYPPTPTRDLPPVAEYTPPGSPTGFGTSPGGFPPAGGLPPPGGFPPSGFPPSGPPPPGGFLYDAPTDYAAYEVIKTRLYTLFEPAAVLVVGVVVFVVIRHYVLPYLIYWARSLEEDELELELEQRALRDPATLNILRAVSRGICLSRISCQLGVVARHHAITDIAISAIEEEKNPPRLAAIFRDAALGRVGSCQPYFCKRQSPSPSPSTSPATSPSSVPAPGSSTSTQDPSKRRRRRRNTSSSH